MEIREWISGIPQTEQCIWPLIFLQELESSSMAGTSGTLPVDIQNCRRKNVGNRVRLPHWSVSSIQHLHRYPTNPRSTSQSRSTHQTQPVEVGHTGTQVLGNKQKKLASWCSTVTPDRCETSHWSGSCQRVSQSCIIGIAKTGPNRISSPHGSQPLNLPWIFCLSKNTKRLKSQLGGLPGEIFW